MKNPILVDWKSAFPRVSNGLSNGVLTPLIKTTSCTSWKFKLITSSLTVCYKSNQDNDFSTLEKMW